LNQTDQTDQDEHLSKADKLFELSVGEERMMVHASQFSINKDRVERDREETEKLVFDLSRFYAQCLQLEIDLDTEYRVFRATKTNAILSIDPKVSEWKMKARIEASAEYAAFKEGIAIVKRNVSFLDLLLDLAYHKLEVIETLKRL